MDHGGEVVEDAFAGGGGYGWRFFFAGGNIQDQDPVHLVSLLRNGEVYESLRIQAPPDQVGLMVSIPSPELSRNPLAPCMPSGR